MCGIFGILSKKAWDDSAVKLGATTLIHRGPDATGYFTSEDQSVSFGHTRLSILDLSEDANQPMTSASGRYVIIYNGEVYNYRELANELKTLSDFAGLRTSSDTEVILEGFERYGKSFITKLNGMFAFAIYDKDEKNVFLCRDRIGIKPLYYYADADNIVFASELKALTAHEFIKRKLTINHDAISSYLHVGYVPEPYSIWNEIKKFPAGAMCSVSPSGSWELISYWSPSVDVSVGCHVAEIKSELKSLLNSSVQYRLISDAPLGTFLSGGIDSSLVSALAAGNISGRLKTFTIGFDDGKFDERKYANQV
ncbi:MAG: asparagine synthase (glutamine-hydrolyzing), partial [Proteobacteria bacterium]|nr:asparagine synthase (glutamine-hydrolyzing) [Pseudomonadota bacterium]